MRILRSMHLRPAGFIVPSVFFSAKKALDFTPQPFRNNLEPLPEPRRHHVVPNVPVLVLEVAQAEERPPADLDNRPKRRDVGAGACCSESGCFPEGCEVRDGAVPGGGGECFPERHFEMPLRCLRVEVDLDCLEVKAASRGCRARGEWVSCGGDSGTMEA